MHPESRSGYVKGSWIVDYVKTIREMRKLPAWNQQEWDKYLSSEDWDFIDSNVLHTQLCPLDQYKRISLAIFKIGARENLDVVKLFGRVMMRDTLLPVYKNIALEGYPVQSAEKFTALRDVFFRGISSTRSTVVESNANHVLIKTELSEEDAAFPAIIALPYQMSGNIEQLVETVGMISAGKLKRVKAKSEVRPDISNRVIEQATSWNIFGEKAL